MTDLRSMLVAGAATLAVAVGATAIVVRVDPKPAVAARDTLSARPAADARSATIAASSSPRITVYKSASCGCCAKWVEHLRVRGFEVDAKDTDDLASVKATLGVPEDLQSCHTAVVDGYVIEGHTPAADIARLLNQRPKVAGLAVPGMPLGSPGMEAARSDRYDVVSFDRVGRRAVFAKH